MVEVFRTNVNQESTSLEILKALRRHFPDHKINFDLEDCDNILRVEAARLQPGEIILAVRRQGFACEPL